MDKEKIKTMEEILAGQESEITKKFNTKEAERQQLIQRRDAFNNAIADCVTELHRIQGEMRFLEGLRAKMKPEDTPPEDPKEGDKQTLEIPPEEKDPKDKQDEEKEDSDKKE